MLEQAVIDAEALREAAMKNAEQEVLEKYSGEIKEAVSSLLEQEEEDLFGDEEDLGPGDEEPEERENVVDQLGMAALDGESACPCPEEEEPIVLDLDQIVAAAQAAESEEEMDLGGEVAADEEELFEVNDDNLLEAIAQALNEEDEEDEEEKKEGEGETQKGDPDKTKPDKFGYERGEIGGKVFEYSEAEEAYRDRKRDSAEDDWAHIKDLEHEAHADRREEPRGDYRDYEHHRDATEDDWSHIMKLVHDAHEDHEERMHENEEELDEELLDEIVEALVVDLKNVPSGDIFHTHPTMGQNERGLDIALAQEQDTEFAEEQKELRQALKKLQEQVKSQKLELNKQKKDFDNLKSIAIKATKKLEEVNFSNAKLIYTNRILKSDSLNERQKNKLVEAISKVGSVEEAKIVYDTLNENLASKSKVAPKSLNEAVSKNNPLILKSNKEKQSAGQNQVSRLKRLAGII